MTHPYPHGLSLFCSVSVSKVHKGNKFSVIVVQGFLVSLDDFYILGSGLVMLQTTNSVFNETLIKQVVPESLLAWQRVRIANMMANDGKTWAETFSKCNSGKYSCICILGKKICSLYLLCLFHSLGRTCNSLCSHTQEPTTTSTWF